MRLTPPSERAIFANVQEFYDAEIVPLQHDAERRRFRAMRDAFLIGAIGVAISLFFVGSRGDTGIIPAIVAGMTACVAAGARINATRAQMTNEWLSRIAGHIGFAYQRNGSRPEYLEPFLRYGLVRRFNRERWEDEITGAHNGVRFSVVEAHLKRRSGGKRKGTRTVFHGQLIAVDFPTDFSGVTIVKRDAGMLNALGDPGNGFRRVGLASSRFEKAFEAWSTDQVDARTLLDPVMLERFEELDRLFGEAKFRAVFENGALLIALDSGDRMSIGSMFRPIDGPSRVQRLLTEFDLIFDLIDVATGRAKAPLNEALSIKHVRAG